MTQPLALRLIGHVAMALSIAAGLAVAGLAILIVTDITGREIFGYSLQGTDELGGYVLAFAGSLGLSWTLLKRGHPRIDIFFRFLPNILRDALHVLAQAGIAALAVFMTVQASGELGETLRFGAVTNTPLQTPLWVPQGIWLLGTGFFALTACATTAHALILFFTDRAAVTRFFGPMTVEEEVGEYVDIPEGTN